MLKQPKYLHSIVTDGPTPGIYIVHTVSPRCICVVKEVEGKTRVYMHEQWEPMTADQEQKLCLGMKNWYYFKFVKTSD